MKKIKNISVPLKVKPTDLFELVYFLNMGSYGDDRRLSIGIDDEDEDTTTSLKIILIRSIVEGMGYNVLRISYRWINFNKIFIYTDIPYDEFMELHKVYNEEQKKLTKHEDYFDVP